MFNYTLFLKENNKKHGAQFDIALRNHALSAQPD